MGSIPSREERELEEEEDDIESIYGKEQVQENASQCCHEVFPRVYIGGLESVCDPRHLLSHPFTHVVSCLQPGLIQTVRSNAATTEEKEAVERVAKNWISLDFIEKEDTYLEPIVSLSNDFIHNALKSNSTSQVLIHCVGGTGRSGVVAISYLMHYHNMRAREALKHIQKIRHIVNPKRGLRRQLIYLERRLHKSTDIDGPVEYEDDVDVIYGKRVVQACVSSSCHEVYPRIYVGSLDSVCDPSEIGRLGVTHVVSCLYPEIKEVMMRNATSPSMKSAAERVANAWLCLDFEDTPITDIGPHVEKAIPFISSALEDPSSKVLIHCMAGASRSASIAISYIMYKEGIPAKKALRQVQMIRPIINPNAGFRSQLLAMEGKLSKK